MSLVELMELLVTFGTLLYFKVSTDIRPVFEKHAYWVQCVLVTVRFADKKKGDGASQCMNVFVYL